jgi:hypothetical protein
MRHLFFRIVIDQQIFFCHELLLQLFSCAMIFFVSWSSLGLCGSHSLIGYSNLGFTPHVFKTLHATTTLSRCRFWIIIFLLSSISLLEMQWFCLRFACEFFKKY